MSKALKLCTLFCLSLLIVGCKPKPAPQDVNLTTQIDSYNAEASPDLKTTTPTTTGQQATMQPTTATISATQATISTSKGDIVIKLYPKEAPNTVQNFLSKAESNFYSNLTFHRVEDWVIQGGDPKGNGTGGGQMPTELNQVPFKTGSVGVARGGNIKISNDAQFFICTTDCDWLTGQYTNFGEVIEGMDVAQKIAVGDTIKGITYQ